MVLRGAGSFFVVSTFVVTFCNSVLIYCAIRSFEGERATFGEGLAAAAERWPQLLGWSIMTVMLGSALKMYANIWRRRNIPGFAASFGLTEIIGVGMLDAAIYFVLPVMVDERIGPSAAIKRSAELIRKRWGEVVIGESGLGGIVVLCLLPLFAITVDLAIAGDRAIITAAVLIPAAVVTAVAILAVLIVAVALSNVFVAGAYAYTIRGNLPATYGAVLMEQMFKKASPKTPAEAAKPE